MSDLYQSTVISKGSVLSDHSAEFNRTRSTSTDLHKEITVQVSPGDFPSTTLSKLFKSNHKDNADVAFAHQDHHDSPIKETSFSQYYSDSVAFAKSLIHAKCPVRGVVCIKGFNNPRWNTAFMGTILANMVGAGIYPTNGPEATKYILDYTNCELAVVDTVAHAKQLLDLNCHKLRMIVVYSECPGESFVADSRVEVFGWEQFLLRGKEVSDEVIDDLIEEQKPGQCACLVFTSGTTGKPKGVMLSHDGVSYASRLSMLHLGLTREDSVVSYLPLSHVAGCMVDIIIPICSGHKVFYALPDALKGGIVKTLRKARPTVFLGVPRVYEKIKEALEPQLTGLKKHVIKAAMYANRKFFESLLEMDRESDYFSPNYIHKAFDCSVPSLDNDNTSTAVPLSSSGNNSNANSLNLSKDSVESRHSLEHSHEHQLLPSHHQPPSSTQNSSSVSAIPCSKHPHNDQKKTTVVAGLGDETPPPPPSTVVLSPHSSHSVHASSGHRRHSSLKSVVKNTFMEAKGLIAKKLPVSPVRSLTQALNRVFINPLVVLSSKTGSTILIDRIKHALGLDRVKYFATGAAPMDPECFKFFLGLGMPLCEVFALSESSGILSASLPVKEGFKRGKSPVFQGVQVAISKSADEISHGSAGELCFRGRAMLMGYLGDEKATNEAIDANGFFNTGDVCEVDLEGFLRVVGRTKELIITAGGENVAPVPLENNIIAELRNLVSNVVVIGDRMKYLTAIMTIPQTESADLTENTISFLRENGIENVSSVDEALSSVEVLALVKKGLIRANKNAPSRAQFIQKAFLLDRDWSEHTGEVTSTMKIKRKVVTSKFASQIKRLYSDEPETIFSEHAKVM